MSTANTSHDFTSEIIQNSLQAIAAEMFDAMRMTAMSPVIYEVLDMGTGILNAKGEMASSGAGIPVLVGVVDKAVHSIVAKHCKSGDIEEGDVFVTNDPEHGGVTHLNDIAFAMPVFVDGVLIAWTANSAHWNDVGGMVPGSMSISATETYQEGLRLPAVKLIGRGEVNRSVVDIIKANSRMPDFSEGDMWAGIAAVRGGERRIKELATKYGRQAFLTALEESMDLAEKVSIAALGNLPKGRFELAEPQDDGSTYKVVVEISDRSMTVDLSDNPRSGANSRNLSRGATEIAAQMVFKSLTDCSSPANGGSFRPLRVVTKPGTLFDAQSPAAVSYYFENLIRAHDLILQCIGRQCPERVCAGTFSSNCVTFVGGKHHDTQRDFTLVEPELGGWGATAKRDGNHAMFSGIHGDTFNCPVEVAETRYGIYVDQLALNPDIAGAGQYRGGRGVVMDYRLREDGGSMTCGFSRSVELPWGLLGGSKGSPNFIELRTTDGGVRRCAFDSDVHVDQDDVVRVITGNGAGYGDPKKRDPEAVRRDVRDELITAAQAHAIYGVTV